MLQCSRFFSHLGSYVCYMMLRNLKILSRNAHRNMAHVLTLNETYCPHHNSLNMSPMNPNYTKSN